MKQQSPNTSGDSSNGLDITKKCLGDIPKLEDSHPWIYAIDNPYLHGLYAPVHRETTSASLVAEGEIPGDLNGAYFRNGPNPQFSPEDTYHPFDGDGMVHAIYFNSGEASYCNKYIHTPALLDDREHNRALLTGVMGKFDYEALATGIKDTANTDILLYNKRLIASWYLAGFPENLSPKTLESISAFELEDRSFHRMSAHSHIDYSSGELLFMDYGDEAPYMTFGLADSNGKLINEIPIDLPGPRAPHDLGFTTNYAILHDHPFFHNMDILKKYGRRVVEFHRDLPTRYAVVPRNGTTHDVRWFECDPGYVLHVTNCWEEDDWIVMDGCRSTNPMPTPDQNEGALASMLSYMRLEANNYRWRFNLKTGEVREGALDDLNTEFNKPNTFLAGTKTRYAYHQRIPLKHEGGGVLSFSGLIKYDNETGCHDEWSYGRGVFGSEAVFAPKDHSQSEDDGYVITIITDTNQWQSQALVFDAQDISLGPMTRIKLPQRVPAGFHASWGRACDMMS